MNAWKLPCATESIRPINSLPWYLNHASCFRTFAGATKYHKTSPCSPPTILFMPLSCSRSIFVFPLPPSTLIVQPSGPLRNFVSSSTSPFAASQHTIHDASMRIPASLHALDCFICGSGKNQFGSDSDSDGCIGISSAPSVPMHWQSQSHLQWPYPTEIPFVKKALAEHWYCCDGL